MTECADRALALHALVDGELDALAAVELEEHLRTCASCRSELDTLERLRSILREPELRPSAPPHLRERITAALPQQSSAARSPVGSWPTWSGGALAGALAASLLLLLVVPRVGEPGLTDQLVDSHIRSLQSAHLIDVATSDRHVVKPWFNGRIDYAPQVVDLKEQGFPLVGGRLDVIDRQTVSVLVYRRRLHSINLFIRPRPAIASPLSQRTQQDGYNLVRWTSNGLEFWAVSDLGTAELDQFRQAFMAAARA
jgi:anti-sigma factor RsiW